MLGYARSGARALRQCGATNASEKLARSPRAGTFYLKRRRPSNYLVMPLSSHAFANHCVIDLQAAFWLQGLHGDKDKLDVCIRKYQQLKA